ncbi:Response regulator c-di-GMP phosphodiesterase, RpfG family, contains REC and HD-GYP domains [Pseudobutyrivibrio sp. YE44]|uniref:HD-GYP domain-containing protein n=1 Tax=Pseudobutyrivibrio sp. YE44 TaxID=1520802 RepID=UPI00088A6CAC|nr:HD domain-containing phosphohydrolase [Pseudobutyrivibrio sp. YE44]SDB50907.1 Response regulator c-di-GMP phosphodiesterase, RpfG family, contains REC and HD-GYP domains [Pseudobutyrivibrio sp. YE44]
MKGKQVVNKDIAIRQLIIIVGITINVLLSYFVYLLDLPIFLDTIGTIAVSILAGPFPGVAVAMLTNVLCTAFNEVAIYFGFINTLTAIFAYWYVKNRVTRSFKTVSFLILGSALISGILGALTQLQVFSGPESPFIMSTSKGISSATGIPFVLSFILVNTILHILDKGITVGLALNINYFVPEKYKQIINDGKWRQKSLTEDQIKKLRNWSKGVRFSMRVRLTLVQFGVSIGLILLMSIVGMQMFFKNDIAEKRDTAVNVAKFAATMINGDHINDYLREGEDYPGYKETSLGLQTIRNNAAGLQYLYVVKIDKENTTFIFDVPDSSVYEDYETEKDVVRYPVGYTMPLEEEFKPYLEDLLAGNEIPPVEIKTQWQWMIAAYSPVFDSNGNCVCWVGADASINYIADYLMDFMWRILLIMFGVMTVILAFSMWTTNAYMVYPINSIAVGVEDFIQAGDDQKKLDEAIRALRKLDIHTDDEVERLYYAICDLTLNQAEQMRSIRHFSESTARMQDGLIITMADLVEKRDVNSGAHIQKTAAYVKIIVEALQKKGYYAGKINQKFISDLSRSAPLHDIGKINVPDNVLNKMGEYTEEEYEIIKSHTTSGMKILENAISTVAGENYLKEARNMAAYHHERWDGNGYPEGLHGEVIPLSARIMAVANQFDIWTSGKNDSKQYSFDEAVSLVEEGAGTEFDPKCVEAFLDSLPEIKVIYRKYNKN